MPTSRHSASTSREGAKAGWKRTARKVLGILASIVLLVFVASKAFQTAVLSFLYPGLPQYTHSRLSLLEMSLTHLLLTLGASLLSGLTGIGLGILVTRKSGREFLGIVQRMNALIQTFPPSAVIILAFPFLGFGWKPTLAALFLYSLFPVLGNTVLGFQQIQTSILDAADGMGMTEVQKLRIVELPQAHPFILTGLRHSFILNVGTASIGAVIGSGGLGTIIISGLTLQNSALVLSGTLCIVGLALLGDALLSMNYGRNLPRH